MGVSLRQLDVRAAVSSSLERTRDPLLFAASSSGGLLMIFKNRLRDWASVPMVPDVMANRSMHSTRALAAPEDRLHYRARPARDDQSFTWCSWLCSLRSAALWAGERHLLHEVQMRRNAVRGSECSPRRGRHAVE